MLKKLGLALIRLYQLALSPILGTSGKCLHQPSCSDYAKEALQTHGVFYGSFLACKRILKCNPACTCGVDPIPRNINNKQVKK